MSQRRIRAFADRNLGFFHAVKRNLHIADQDLFWRSSATRLPAADTSKAVRSYKFVGHQKFGIAVVNPGADALCGAVLRPDLNVDDDSVVVDNGGDGD